MTINVKSATAWVTLIGTIVVLATPWIASQVNESKWRTKTDAKLESQLELLTASDEAASELLDAKLDPITETLGNLQDELGVAQANLEAIEIATTEGSDARTRLLAGRIHVLQEDVLDLQQNQIKYAGSLQDSIAALRTRLHEIEMLMEPDTVRVAVRDTIVAEPDSSDGGGFFDWLPF